MARRTTPPALARSVLLAALTLALASCGGGSIAGPIAQSTAPTTTSSSPPVPMQAAAPPTTTTATAPAAPRTTATAPTPRTAPRPTPARPAASAAPTAPRAPVTESSAPPRAQPVGTPLDERATLVLTRRVTAAHYFQLGTVTGTYAGTMAVEARITAKGVLVSFTATLPGGTISGRAVAVAILDSATWPGLRGSAVITGGTGRFAGIHGRGLRVTGRSEPDASHTHVRLRGAVELA